LHLPIQHIREFPSIKPMNRAVTLDDVIKIADALQAQGLTPSVRAVREHTGGSHTTVCKHLNAWQALAASRQVPPKEVEDAIAALARTAWHAATDVANRRVEEVKTLGEAQVAQTTQAAEEAHAEVDRLTEALATAQEQAADRKRELDELQQALTTVSAECTAARNELHVEQLRGAALASQCATLKEQLAAILMAVGTRADSSIRSS
jgi:chromosome segregation ATPase